MHLPFRDRYSQSFTAGSYSSHLLNQERAGLRPAHDWFLRIASVREFQYVCVCVCVCPPPRLSITSGMMWYDIDLIRLVE